MGLFQVLQTQIFDETDQNFRNSDKSVELCQLLSLAFCQPLLYVKVLIVSLSGQYYVKQ